MRVMGDAVRAVEIIQALEILQHQTNKLWMIHMDRLLLIVLQGKLRIFSFL